MTLSVSSPLICLCLASLLAPANLHASPEKTRATKKLDVPIPISRNARGLRIPSFDAEGRLRMFFNIDSAFRVDEGHLRMTNLRIETFDDHGKSDVDVYMPFSMLDLKTNIVSSKEPVTIKRSDFDVTGSNMTFNPQTRIGKFIGPVRMLIFNSADLDQKPASAVAENPRKSQP